MQELPQVFLGHADKPFRYHALKRIYSIWIIYSFIELDQDRALPRGIQDDLAAIVKQLFSFPFHQLGIQLVGYFLSDIGPVQLIQTYVHLVGGQDI